MRFPRIVNSFCLILLIFGGSRVTGQVPVGIKAGWNHNFPKYDADVKTDQSLSGWHAGLYTQFSLAKNLFLIPELQFSTRNYRLDLFMDDLRFGYIEIPLMLSWSPAKWINLEAGPNIAFKMYSKTENGVSVDEVFDQNIDVGFVVGPRFNFTNNLSVVTRYWWSIVPFSDHDFYNANGVPLGKLEVYNRAVEISFAWTFNPIQ